MIWTVAVTTVVLWPLGGNRSLVVQGVHFVADPKGTLPFLPPPLPMGLGDDGEVVMLHDQQTAEFYDAYDASAWTRVRMRVRDWRDPVDPATERQLLIALLVLGALFVWRLDGRGATEGSPDRGSPGPE